LRCLTSPDINSLIAEVTKPGRYSGNCINFPAKSEGYVRFLLCFPDVFEIGMSNLGLRILYHVLNRHPELMADLAFAPWVDMEAFMRQRRLSLCGLGTGLVAGEFDVVGFSLQHELQYTNVLAMLDLAGIPLRSRERTDGEPIVIAGGPCAYNPEPMADFIDAFVVGDGESPIVEIGEVIARAKAKSSRSELLEKLAEIDGVYVPHLDNGKTRRIVRRLEQELRDEDFPIPPIVPVAPITHDRLTLEIMRGCTHGCRFCSAGMVTRPIRLRSVESILSLAQAGIESTGWEEISLISLSSSDYPDIGNLVKQLADRLHEQRVSISLPSMRPGTFTEEMADLISSTKRTGLTFAPEAGSDRLRRRINKVIEEGELLASIETAFRRGWDGIKLYFMVGLPGEDMSDINELIRVVRSVEAICRVYGQRKHITVSLSPFVPRPQTPFQWEAQVPPDEILARIRSIRKNLPGRRIRIKWRDPLMAQLEGMLARGDRGFGKAILEAYLSGSRFESWTDRFDLNIWLEAFDHAGIDVSQAFVAKEPGESLPWDHIDAGVSREFLAREARKAQIGETTLDCRLGGCTQCGACDGKMLLESRATVQADGRRVRIPSGCRSDQIKIRFRVRYAKREEMALASHLDITRCIHRALRRARLPISYSEGFSPHPRVAFGPPLPLGCLGESEYFDVMLTRLPPGNWIQTINTCLPRGLVVLDGNPVELRAKSLTSLVNAATYRVEILEAAQGVEQPLEELLADLEASDWVISVRAVRGRMMTLEIAARILKGRSTPEKVLDRLLRPRAKRYRIVRTGLFMESSGKLKALAGDRILEDRA